MMMINDDKNFNEKCENEPKGLQNKNNNHPIYIINITMRLYERNVNDDKIY